MGSSERSFGYKFARSVTILADTAKVLLRHPILILPILIGWIFYFVEIIYFKYYFNWNACTQNQLFLVILTHICRNIICHIKKQTPLPAALLTVAYGLSFISLFSLYALDCCRQSFQNINCRNL